MLPKKNRLKKKKDIEKVFKNGKTYKESFLLFKLIKNNLFLSRFGFVVGQKISKKAIARNRIKRKMRETIKRDLPNIEPGFDGLLVALKGTETKNSKEIAGVIKKLLQSSGICH